MAYVTWRVDKALYYKVAQLWALAWEAEEAEGEGSEMHLVYVDEVRSLPGFPLRYDWRCDTLILEEVGKPTSYIHREN